MTDAWDDTSTVVRGGDSEPLLQQCFVLSVLDGPDKGLRVPFEGTVGCRLFVGKGPTCELRLRDPSVSRRHAVFEITPNGLRVTDLDSKNGTGINGVRVVEAYARGSDRVSVSGTAIGVEEGPPKPASLATDQSFGRMLGSSREMRRLYPLCQRLATSELPVLIEGETGTGKEVLAEALHERSLRASAPFVVFDCTAVPPSLAETSLFGHERGAFTGAVAPRVGVFESAHGGTLFIDEIGELEPTLQPKLLRALERGEVQRVGSNQWTRIDVRVIAATRRDLEKEVQAGRFRDDLFFRLAVGRVELPPLRERTGDIALLASQFWNDLDGQPRPIPPALIQRLEDYRWPGNVRELHNAVARAIALGEAAATEEESGMEAAADLGIRAAAAGELIDRVLAADLPLTRARDQVVSEFERRYVARVLERHGGNVVKAAAASGIARRYFQILRARYKSEP